MSTIFSETLKRLRTEAGFPTAYRFYHANGGAAGLKLSYRKYLAMEQGKILPVFERLDLLISGLKVIRLGEAANELVVAWLKTTAGEKAFKLLLEPIINIKATSSFSPMEKTVKRSISNRKYHVNVKQFGVIAENRENYLCFLALINDESKWRPADLAKFMELTPEATAKALEALAKVKLLKKYRDGRYDCPLCGMMLEYPNVQVLPPEMGKKFMGHFNDLLAKGKPIWMRVGTVRADYDSLGDYLQLMQLNISAIGGYGITKATKKSALFAVKGSVELLRNF